MSVPDILLGERVTAVGDLTRPWAVAVRTSLVTLADGRRLVHQAGLPTRAGRAGIRRRIRFARALRAAASGLPVPEVLDGDAEAGVPWVVTRHVDGVTADTLLAQPAGARLAGTHAGGVAASLAAVGPARAGRSLPRTWGGPTVLRAAAGRWLVATEPWLAPPEVRAARALLGRIPGLFATPPGLAHGDLAPVNLVVDAGRLAAVLDLERLRLAPAGFDAAWFRLIVRHHHPAAWSSAGPALLAAIGLPDDAATAARLDDLALLACLEAIAGLPRPSPARAAWVSRILELLAAERGG